MSPPLLQEPYDAHAAAMRSTLTLTSRERFLREARQALVGPDLPWRFVLNFYLASKSALR